MKEYIDKGAAIEKTESLCDTFVIHWTDEKVLAWIRQLPAADVVERKRGEWEHRVESHHDTHTDEYWDEGYFVCSECGESWWDTTNFCPNCGCQMVGVKDGRD